MLNEIIAFTIIPATIALAIGMYIGRHSGIREHKTHVRSRMRDLLSLLTPESHRDIKEAMIELSFERGERILKSLEE
jgi:hypothetical protein